MPAHVVDRVVGVEELLLGALLADEKMDVVHKPQVHASIPAAELRAAVFAQGRDVVVGECFSGDVCDPCVRADLHNELSDSLHQVGLAQPRAAVDEQRIIGLAGAFGDGHCTRVSQAVGRPDDERVEVILTVERLRQRLIAGLGARLGLLGELLRHDRGLVLFEQLYLELQLESQVRLQDLLDDGKMLFFKPPSRKPALRPDPNEIALY